MKEILILITALALSSCGSYANSVKSTFYGYNVICVQEANILYVHFNEDNFTQPLMNKDGSFVECNKEG